MYRSLYEEQCATECPFSFEKELNELNSRILRVVKKRLSGEQLSPQEVAALLDDCQCFEHECKHLNGEARFYAERTMDLGNLAMNGEIAACA